MISTSRKKYFLILIAFSMLFALSCSDDTSEPVIEKTSGCSNEGLLESFTDTGGNSIFIYEDGGAYIESDEACKFELQYFEPDFKTQNYLINDQGTFFLSDGQEIAVKNNFFETNEANRFIDLFANDASDPNLYWSSFTLQSPLAKTVSEYVALSKCILNETCDFRDNRIEIVEDPVDSSNKVLRFESVAPTADMVVSKCSLSSLLGFFEKDDDVWFEADYLVEHGMPFSLVDFESSFFEGSPGPRVVINNGKLELDNKFGAKLRYRSTSQTTVPLNEWFKIKVHLKFSNDENGVLELWQDDEKLISATGISMQTANGIQNILEVGISATNEETAILVDNIRVSSTIF